jgi:rapamycin-insensitive companion of mTOR
MSTPVGFRYLYNSEYIDREMDSWFHVCPLSRRCSPSIIYVFIDQERNYHYVVQVEVFLAKAFSPTQPANDDDLL